MRLITKSLPQPAVSQGRRRIFCRKSDFPSLARFSARARFLLQLALNPRNPTPSRARLIFPASNFNFFSLNFPISLRLSKLPELRIFGGVFGFPPESHPSTRAFPRVARSDHPFHCPRHVFGPDQSWPPTSTYPSTPTWRKGKEKEKDFLRGIGYFSCLHVGVDG